MTMKFQQYYDCKKKFRGKAHEGSKPLSTATTFFTSPVFIYVLKVFYVDNNVIYFRWAEAVKRKQARFAFLRKLYIQYVLKCVIGYFDK